MTARDELLRSYANGPRIWDAAALLPDVLDLAEAGLIEPVPGPDSGGAYRLTDAGREMVRRSVAAVGQHEYEAADEVGRPCKFCGLAQRNPVHPAER